MNTPVTMHFTLEEMYASATAKAKGINNKPSTQQMINLVYLAAYVLEPLRVAMNEPIKIGSGFRSQALNKAVGGVYNSQHLKGQAADLCIDGDIKKGRKWFPEEENSRLMAASGMSHSTLHRFARELGLTKSEKGWKRIKKIHAAHVKRLCEKNGYYDSIRGKKPSEACRKATAQMWQDIRDGKREHPARIMKRKNPRKYRKWMQRRSDERKETIRKEKRRVIYGMERKTRLRCIVICPYTKRQVSHRYNALKRGYIVMEDCTEQGGERYNIYYDDQTQRAPIFEKNLLKDGFKIKKWND